ncbi:MAG: hypothetical protein AAGA80_16520 [Cyanobacteria bacterium P01_F01_bin.143]
MLGEFHKEPADRILVAITRRYDIPIVSRDLEEIRYAGRAASGIMRSQDN